MSEPRDRAASPPAPSRPAPVDVTGATIVDAGLTPPVALDELDEQPLDLEDRYEERSLLGAGGMGEVHLCHDRRIGRDIARKTLRAPSVESRRALRPRFLREVRVQGQLEHPSVVPVYDLGATDDGGVFFTMRRVRGQTLHEVIENERSALLKGRPPTWTRRKLLIAFRQLCLAVDYAHTRGVIHRDLKPGNIMLGDFGEVYLLDWGIAKLVTAATPTAPGPTPTPTPNLDGELTSPGTLVGTPGYMSPEQALGLRQEQDARSDVYALGAILFEVLTLEPLHSGRTIEDLIASTVRGELPRPAQVRTDVEPELDAVCLRATATDRARRYASARELSDAIEAFLDGARDLELRREAAARHALTAARAASSSDETTRVDAMQEVFKALALDPDHADARQLLVKLIVDEPATLPAAVEEEMRRTEQRRTHRALRYGFFGFMSWVACIPVVAWMGVKSWPFLACSFALVVFNAGYLRWLQLHPDRIERHIIPLMAGIVATVASFSCWLGPFVLVPTASVCAVLWFAIYTPRKYRLLAAAGGAMTVLVPLVLELCGVVAPSFTFAGGQMILHERGLSLSPVGTALALLYSSTAMTFASALFFGGTSEALRQTERKLFLQAWRLELLARRSPSSPPG